MTPQRSSRQVRVGALTIGGDAPVRIQTMWKDRLPPDPEPVLSSLRRLERFGCELIRFAVPDEVAAERLGRIAALATIPIVADIHFNHSLALQCLDFVDKLRINPGNIGSEQKKREILIKAKDRGVPIRIGINGGSLPADLKTADRLDEAMVEAAARELELFDAMQFSDVVVSLKASDIDNTMRANKLFRKAYDYPLHIGLTEAGPTIQGIVKSSVALNDLLRHGIGETIRVSLSAPCEDELAAAREILRVSGRSRGGATIIACPRCARAGFDVHRFLDANREWLDAIESEISIAVMGCEVNGPEESRHADVGITGSKGKAIVFRNGKIVARVTEEDGGAVLRREIEAICKKS